MASTPALVPSPEVINSNILPPLFANSDTPPMLLAQGAEALLYRTHFLQPSNLCALKYRPSKPYRHPILNARLTRHRILSEARALVRCRREGVSVPAVLALDWEAGWMLIEWIEGHTVREILESRGGSKDEEAAVLMGKIGKAIGRMHEIGVVHGDLTTSNLMVRESTKDVSARERGSGKQDQQDQEEVVLIDFGLAGQSSQDEDKAVDLYVLERAFGSTHPEAEDDFKEVLRVYGESYKGAMVVLKRLEEVRMRGRKRSMVG